MIQAPQGSITLAAMPLLVLSVLTVLLSQLGSLLAHLTPQSLSIILGTCLPPVISVILQPRWTKKVRAVASFVLTVVLGALICYVKGAINPDDWATSIFAFVATAQLLHKVLWSPTGVADTIEILTSPAPKDPLGVLAVAAEKGGFIGEAKTLDRLASGLRAGARGASEEEKP